MDSGAGQAQIVADRNDSTTHPLAFVALLLGNVALAMGPFLVRHSGVGPISAGFWRMALAIPFLWLIARMVKQPVHWPRRAAVLAIALAAFFFAADLAAWHKGILLTKLGNATLFGNISSASSLLPGGCGWCAACPRQSRHSPCYSLLRAAPC